MRNNTFITRLARGAVVSSVVGTCFGPQSHSATATVAVLPSEVAEAEMASVPEAASETGPGRSVIRTVRINPEEWTKQMEHEFRTLALVEAKGNLTGEQLERLGILSAWREQLVEPRPTEEVLLQLRRDRLLENLADALKKYVEFQEGTNKARPVPR